MIASLLSRNCLGVAAFLLIALVGPAALAEPGSAVSALNPNRPAPDGWLAPTLEGDLRYRVAIDAWVPNTLLINASSGGLSGGMDEDLIWLLTHMRWYAPIDLEWRKGTFGLFLDTFAIGLAGGDRILGPITLDWDVTLLMFDVGISYELGRWRLGDEPNAPELTLEPYLEARIIHLPIDIEVLGFSTSEDLSSQVPVIGMRAFIDLTTHWNLEFIGDYGGWGVDDNHQTWQGAAYLGYRWPGWGVHWNLQVGYRAMRLFDLRQVASEISMDVRGANITFGVEF